MLILLFSFWLVAFTSLPWNTPHYYTLTNVASVAQRIENAKTVELSAYVLSAHGRMGKALLQAAAHGAHVHVLLDGVAYGSAGHSNILTKQVFLAHDIRVDLTTYPLHAKVAIIDGKAFLSDRNWASHSRSELVLQDDNPEDIPLIQLVMLGRSATNEHFSTRKREALQLEAGTLSNGASRIAVETEAYTPGSIVESTLNKLALQGTQIRLLVDQREYRHSSKEQRALRNLARAGIKVRIGPFSEKIAFAGSQVWLGSANATPGVPNQIDWGLQLPTAMLPVIESQFEHNWERAVPLAGSP